MRLQHSGTKEREFDALLTDARARTRATGRPVLVSLVTEGPAIDVSGALELVVPTTAFDAALGELAGEARMCWARPADGFALAGIGSVMTIAPNGPARFATVNQAWKTLLEDALVIDPSGAAPGAGPVLMGGFAFDAEGGRADHWLTFGSAKLMVPRLQLAVVGDTSWITTTLLVGPDGQPDVDPAVLARLRTRALDVARDSSRGATNTPRGAMNRQGGGAVAFSDAIPATEWRALITLGVSAIHEKQFEKVVLARAVRARANRGVDLGAVLRHLISAYPDCHVFGCWRGDAVFVGASPELLVGLAGRDVRASSLAGSVKRGATAEEDIALAAGLLESAKEREEHDVVRRSLCAGLAELCDDVESGGTPSLLTLPQVHHLHTAVRARLRPEHTLLNLVARLHPTPAVGGEPRDAALTFITAHERLDRGWYAAPIGWVGRGHGEFAVALRSALLRGREAWLFAGCGIMAESTPDGEFAESLLKLRPMELALESGVAGDTASETAPARLREGSR